MPRHKVPACTPCRGSHLRCDRVAPACSSCRNAEPSRTCDLNKLEIRESSFSTKARQDCKSQRRKTHAQHHGGTEPLPLQRQLPVDNGAPADTSHGDRLAKSAPVVLEPQSGPDSPSIEGRAASHSLISIPSLAESGLTPTSPGLKVAPAEVYRQRRSITVYTEQRVFQFCIRTAGPWLDIVSSQGYFERLVPRLALREPVLYYALMAYSSLVLHLIEGLDKSVHEEFQTLAIAKLIPLLSHCAQADEALLSTAVTLRMMEQFTELGEDAQRHLRGAYSLFTTIRQRWSPNMTDLRGVSFWIYVRESIRACFLNEEGCRFDLDAVDLDCLERLEHEEAWINYVSYLLLKLCDACWGDHTPEERSLIRDEVERALNKWKAGLPDAFEPWSYSMATPQIFPTIMCLSPWHEVAWQKYYTSRAMLAVYSSKRPNKYSMLELNQYIEFEILKPARLACGICLSSHRIGCNLNGCHLIAWCGQFFTGKDEQRIQYDFLKDFADRVKWPNRSCYERLLAIWDGKRTSWKLAE